MQMTYYVAERIGRKVRALGFHTADTELVMEFAERGDVPESSIGQEYDDALCEALMSECDEYGVEV